MIFLLRADDISQAINFLKEKIDRKASEKNNSIQKNGEIVNKLFCL